MAGILGVTPQAVLSRLKGRVLHARVIRARAIFRRQLALDTLRRANWRRKLRVSGVDPHALPVSDPLWSACHTRPRGALVRDVAHEIRAEHRLAALDLPDVLSTEDRLEALCDRVAARGAMPEHARRAAHIDACARAGVAPVDPVYL